MAKHHRKKQRILRRAVWLLLLASFLAAFFLWENTSLETAHFEPTFTDLPAGFDGCRIVVLSDLHGAHFGEGNRRLFTAVKEAAPDISFIWETWRTNTGAPQPAIPRLLPMASPPSPPLIMSQGTTSGPSGASRS